MHADSPLPPPGRMRRVLLWMRSHKWKTLFLVIAGVVLFELLTLPYYGIYKLKSENPGRTALMGQRLREAENDRKPLHIVQQWIPLSRVPDHVIDAIIVAEDGMFFEHGGIDWFEVQESFEKNLQQGRAARGASTITQQLAKNLFLSTSKDPVRKVKEVVITLMMERVLTKERILELYLNIIEWGRGIFGIEAAARTYFGKPASALSIEEASRLAAVIPSPLRHRPDVDSRYVVRRKSIVMTRMMARRMLPPAAQSVADSAGSHRNAPAAQQEQIPEVDTTAEDEGETGDGLP